MCSGIVDVVVVVVAYVNVFLLCSPSLLCMSMCSSGLKVKKTKEKKRKRIQTTGQRRNEENSTKGTRPKGEKENKDDLIYTLHTTLSSPPLSSHPRSNSSR